MKDEKEIAQDIAKIISQITEVYNQAKTAPENIEAVMPDYHGYN